MVTLEILWKIKMNKKNLKTMDEEYGDTSGHLCCPNCGRCIDCGDCKCKMRKVWIKKGFMPKEIIKKEGVKK